MNSTSIVVATETRTIEWANRQIEEGNKLLEKGHRKHIEVAQWIFQCCADYRLSPRKMIEQLIDDGLKVSKSTVYRWLDELPEYKEQQEQKRLSPSEEAQKKRNQRSKQKAETLGDNSQSEKCPDEPIIDAVVVESQSQPEPKPVTEERTFTASAVSVTEEEEEEEDVIYISIETAKRLKQYCKEHNVSEVDFVDSAVVEFENRLRIAELEEENQRLNQEVAELRSDLEDTKYLYDLGENLTDDEIKELLERLQNPEEVDKLIEQVKDWRDPIFNNMNYLIAFAQMGGDSRVGLLEKKNRNIGILRVYAMKRLGKVLSTRKGTTEKMGIRELKKLASERGVKNYGTMKKDELLQALNS